MEVPNNKKGGKIVKKKMVGSPTIKQKQMKLKKGNNSDIQQIQTALSPLRSIEPGIEYGLTCSQIVGKKNNSLDMSKNHQTLNPIAIRVISKASVPMKQPARTNIQSSEKKKRRIVLETSPPLALSKQASPTKMTMVDGNKSIRKGNYRNSLPSYAVANLDFGH